MSRARPCCGSKTARNTPEVPLLPTPTLSWSHLPTDWQDSLAPSHQDLGKRQRGVLTLMDTRYGTDLLPTNGRFLYYEGEQDGWVEKKRYCSNCGAVAKRTDAQNISDTVESLRDMGFLFYEWFTDETRPFHDYNFFDTAEDAMRSVIAQRWLNPWVGVPRPLVLFESRSLQGTMRQRLAERKVAHAAFNGQAGAVLLRTKIVPWLDEHPDSPVLYSGDLDVAGGQIEDWAHGVIEDETTSWSGSWERLMITPLQASVLAAVGMTPITKVDGRYEPKRTTTAWEVEALGQRYVRDTLTTAIDRLLPRPLADVHADEEAEDLLIEEYIDNYDTWKASR